MFNIILDSFSVAGNQGKHILPDVIVDISSAHTMQAQLCEPFRLDLLSAGAGHESGKSPWPAGPRPFGGSVRGPFGLVRDSLSLTCVWEPVYCFCTLAYSAFYLFRTRTLSLPLSLTLFRDAYVTMYRYWRGFPFNSLAFHLTSFSLSCPPHQLSVLLQYV